MEKPETEEIPSWDESWQTYQESLQPEIEEEKPVRCEEAVYHRLCRMHARRRHPHVEWSDVEKNVYEDYMTGAFREGAEEEERP